MSGRQRRHPVADLYREERRQGKTYREIAEKYGVTTQAVGAACAGHAPQKFRAWTPKGCVYPNLRWWMNQNKVNRAELLRRMDIIPAHNSLQRLADYMSGRTDPPKRTIDKILQITGLTYEAAFYKPETEEEETNGTN